MKRILLLEDDVFIRDLASEKFTQADFVVSVSDSGEDALAAMERGEVDLLILDLELDEGMQGMEVLNQMNERELIGKVHVIVFSNNDDPGVKAECKKYGASAFFVKVDTDLNELITKVNEMLTAG